MLKKKDEPLKTQLPLHNTKIAHTALSKQYYEQIYLRAIDNSVIYWLTGVLE